MAVPLCSSSIARGDRLSLFEDRDLKFGGRLGGPRGPSPGVSASDLDLDFDGRLCERGGSSVGVSEYVSEGGLSASGEKALELTALGGNEGRDLSRSIVLFGGG